MKTHVVTLLLGVLLAIPLGATAPPTIDTPLFDCANAVVVRAYDSGATLRVYVNGTLRGTETGATGHATWVDLSAALGGGQAVQATQEVGGVESALSVAAIVAAPSPPPVIRFEPPLEACAQGGYVHNDLAGKISVRSLNGDQLASNDDGNGDLATLYSRALVAGEMLAATVEHCRAGMVSSPPQTVSTLYGERGTAPPIPRIDAGTAVECREMVLVRDVIPGATVRVFDGPTQLGEDVATSSQCWVTLSSPMESTWQLRALQLLCPGAESDFSPAVQPVPLSALGPPVVEGPIWDGQSHVWLDVPISAPTTLTVDGAAVRTDVELSGRAQLNVESPFVAGQMVSALYTLCKVESPPAQPVVVIKPPSTLPPPRVGFPLFACTNGVSVSGVVDQAEVVILIDGQEVHHDFATSITLGQTLQGGQVVTAYQRIGPIQSAKSVPVVVFAAPALERPTVEAPLHGCQRSVTVEDVLPGALVTVFVNGAPFAYGTAFETTVEIPTLPLMQGWSVTARQELGSCQQSGVSAPVTVGPPTTAHEKKAPEIVEPVYACQTSFEVRSLVPGTELDVFVDGVWKKRVPVSAEEIMVSIQPPLVEGQTVRVQPGVCGILGALFDEAVVQPAKIDPPTLEQPIHHGDPSVQVSGVPPGALVRIYNEANNVIGAGMGGPNTVTIFLSTPAQAGDKLRATASLCGAESSASVEVEVRPNRPPLPHDAMVSWFWLDPQNKAQALLHVAGRNVYKGSVVRIDGNPYPTFPMAQLVPGFSFDPATLGTPVDVIGSVVVLLYEDANGQRFSADQRLKLSIVNPDGSIGALRRFNGVVNNYVDRYDLASSMATLDSDGDDLTDMRESPGSTPDLAALGAHPLRKDVFVEVDWMVLENDHTHEPNVQSFDIVREAYASAFVINADGSRGVHLYVDMGQNGGEGGTELDHFDTIEFDAADNPDVLFDHFYDNDFGDDRKGLFHYCVFAHRQPNTEATGLARTPGDKLMVTRSNPGGLDDPEWIVRNAGTFIHELGHNLNLKHGGDTTTNLKPNYPSVMRYGYSSHGISTDCNQSPDGVYTYSYGLYADIDELNLNEPRGICNGVAQDWNSNGNSTDTGFAFNINGDRVIQYDSTGVDAPLFNEFVPAMPFMPGPPLHDYCDWCYLTTSGLP